MNNFYIGQAVKATGELATVIGIREDANMLEVKSWDGSKWGGDPKNFQDAGGMEMNRENARKVYDEYRAIRAREILEASASLVLGGRLYGKKATA